MLSYKEQHELFVSNLAGTGVLDIVILLLFLPSLILLSKFFKKWTTMTFVQDWLLFIVPSLLTLTVLAGINQLLLLIVVILLSLMLFFGRRSEQELLNGKGCNTSFISLFKGTLFQPRNVFLIRLRSKRRVNLFGNFGYRFPDIS